MRTIRLTLDSELWAALSRSAGHDLRPIPNQAEFLIRSALGVPFRSMADDLAERGPSTPEPVGVERQEDGQHAAA